MRPDVVLLDIVMPGMDGYETCRRMRACPALASTKIIMVSSKATTAERLEGYAAGADDYLVKPYEPDELIAKVRVYLRLKSVEEVDRLRSELMDLLNHETRTPLTNILTPIALLMTDPKVTEDQRKLLTTIEAGGQRLLALIERATFLSQIKAGDVPLLLREVDLGEIGRVSVDSAQAKAAKAGVELAFETEGDVPVEADPEHLEAAIDALVDNAVRYTGPGTRVTVHASTKGPWSSISVTDQGPGIEPEFMTRLFEEFTVGDIEHHGRGYGLSLATARAIVEQHGGSLNVKSEAGRGATFWIDLPAHGAASHAA
jgi:signal transduction histidine kinase